MPNLRRLRVRKTSTTLVSDADTTAVAAAGTFPNAGSFSCQIAIGASSEVVLATMTHTTGVANTRIVASGFAAGYATASMVLRLYVDTTKVAESSDLDSTFFTQALEGQVAQAAAGAVTIELRAYSSPGAQLVQAQSTNLSKPRIAAVAAGSVKV